MVFPGLSMISDLVCSIRRRFLFLACFYDADESIVSVLSIIPSVSTLYTYLYLSIMPLYICIDLYRYGYRVGSGYVIQPTALHNGTSSSLLRFTFADFAFFSAASSATFSGYFWLCLKKCFTLHDLSVPAGLWSMCWPEKMSV